MWSISARLKVVASVSASDRWTWNSTCLSAVIFATPYTTSSAAVFIGVSFLANMLLRPVALVPTSSNSCRSWCWINLSKTLPLTGVIWWISRSNRSIALCRSGAEHFVAACRARFRRTWNCISFDVVTFSAPYTWTSIAAQSVWICCSRN